jgi:hypothetical protein
MLSCSSAEAKYRGMANVVVEASWIWKLLHELTYHFLHTTFVFCGNVSAIHMSTNPVQRQRTKHIKMDLHFVRNHVAMGQVRVLHVPSSQQFNDILTKGLPSPFFLDFWSSLNVRSLPVMTAGEC